MFPSSFYFFDEGEGPSSSVAMLPSPKSSPSCSNVFLAVSPQTRKTKTKEMIENPKRRKLRPVAEKRGDESDDEIRNTFGGCGE
jgi:hypothetical protein